MSSNPTGPGGISGKFRPLLGLIRSFLCFRQLPSASACFRSGSCRCGPLAACLSSSLAGWGIFYADNTINLFWVAVFADSLEMSNPPIIRDKANRRLVSNSSLLLPRKQFRIRPIVTELIECTCSTTLELSFRIPVSVYTISFRNNNPDGVLF